MTRNDYFEQLNQVLGFLDADTRSATLAFYEELLSDRMEEGLSEQDALRMMDAPDVIAARMRADMGQQGTLPPDDSDIPAYTPCTISYDVHQVASLFLSFINRKVKVESGDTPYITVSYMEDERHPIDLTELDGHIRLTEKQPMKQGLARFSTFGLGNVLDALFRGRTHVDLTVTVVLPRDAKIGLEIITSNGGITMQNFNALGTVRLTTSNASVHVRDVACSQLRLCTSNGRVDIENIAARQGIAVRTSNAAIHASLIRAHDAVSLTTTNSAVRLEKASGGDILSVRTTNASITCNGCLFPCVTLKTSNGKIAGTMPGSIADYNVDAGTTNGSCSLPSHKANGSRTLIAHTSNASIQMHFEDDMPR